MADTLPTLVNSDFNIKSRVNAPIKLIRLKLGDGNEQRVADGENNTLLKLKIVYKALDETDFNTLLTFIIAHSGGESFTVPNKVFDPSGATTFEGFITAYTVDHGTSPIAWDLDILIEEAV